jgi:BirA family biotin operon repressor/biotin-[acetyl-CoA-carboxylase] ligase
MNPHQPQRHLPLDMPLIRRQLAQSPIGHTLLYHTSVPSTMPIAAELARKPETPSGVVVVAEEQTSGRGRRDRRWQAPYGSALLVSIILKPPQYQLPLSALTMLAGNALLTAVLAVVPSLQDELLLKWPNDLLIGREAASAAKTAGILAESTFAADGSLSYAILGIGVNANQQAADLPRIAPPTPRPTSLRVAANRIRKEANQNGARQDDDQQIDRSALLIHLCTALSASLTQTPAAIYQEWKGHLSTLGHTVAVYATGVEQGPTLIGKAVDVQEDGALVVMDETGAKQAFYAADVSVRVTT